MTSTYMVMEKWFDDSRPSCRMFIDKDAALDHARQIATNMNAGQEPRPVGYTGPMDEGEVQTMFCDPDRDTCTGEGLDSELLGFLCDGGLAAWDCAGIAAWVRVWEITLAKDDATPGTPVSQISDAASDFLYEGRDHYAPGEAEAADDGPYGRIS